MKETISSFIETNKALVVPVVAGAALGLVLNWLDVPAWIVGAVVAAVVARGSDKLMALYESHVAPRLGRNGGH
ncbi:hypothetical protein [uncultured Lentibacter sp.]|jgi:hypothetical protein|uniref:hypothetical protein n=1 Tax=uncultured Lentibacter sp. TaxID=1659309 RepID=UPI002613ADE6|nr:hypothetical protein [uncultured Lentibacter sp.]